MTTTPLTDQQLADTQAELAPLARVIAITLKATPVRLGDPADLIAALTLQVAAYMGPLVGDVPAELDRLGAELGRVRAELATACEQTAEAIVAGLSAIHDHPETAERNRPGLRMAMRNAHRFVAPAAAVPSA